MHCKFIAVLNPVKFINDLRKTNEGGQDRLLITDNGILYMLGTKRGRASKRGTDIAGSVSMGVSFQQRR
jgi:hypothetical protein